MTTSRRKTAKVPKPPLVTWTATDPATIARYLAESKCLGCGCKGMNLPSNIDPETGFTSQYCVNCRKHNQAARPKKSPGAAKFRKAHKAEGLDNLDRLMGIKP